MQITLGVIIRFKNAEEKAKFHLEAGKQIIEQLSKDMTENMPEEWKESVETSKVELLFTPDFSDPVN